MKKGFVILIVAALILGIFIKVGVDKSEETVEPEMTMALLVPSEFGDLSFNDSARAGAERLEEDFNIDVTYVECKEENYKQNMANAAENSEMVVCVGWEFWEIEEIADDYPNVDFIWVDNRAAGNHGNLMCITYEQNEGSYLAGYIAAAKSESGIIGVVGGDNAPTINDFITGYEQGAAAYNPDIQILKTYANGNYSNPELGKELALTLNSRGADIIFQVAGYTGRGVFEAAREKGFYAIGVDEDQKISAPDYEDLILCSMVKEIGKSIYNSVSAVLSDESAFKGGETVAVGMADGYVAIAYGTDEQTQLVSDDLKKEVNRLGRDIESGKLRVDAFVPDEENVENSGDDNDAAAEMAEPEDEDADEVE